MTRLRSRTPPRSCAGCFAWGILPGRFCSSCVSFASNRRSQDPGPCAGCHRTMPLKQDYCRLCWAQAKLEAKVRGEVVALDQVHHHQLFFAGLLRPLAPNLRGHQQQLGASSTEIEPGQPPPTSDHVQLRLPVEVIRDFTRFEPPRGGDRTNPWLVLGRAAARTIGEARGWKYAVRDQVDRAVAIVLSNHTDGDKITYSALYAVRHRLNVARTAEVLDHLGLLVDDRIPPIEHWLEQRLNELPPSMRSDVEHWIMTLYKGGPRVQARGANTARHYMSAIHPILLGWADHYHHLREVTPDDITTVTDSLKGSQRRYALSVLRSLFRHSKKTRRVFHDPTARIRPGRSTCKMIVPLQPADIDGATAAATTPGARLILVLAAVHAARNLGIRELQLHDVDLGNRRLVIAGKARPLDDLTYQTILEWLDYRRLRWPNTANPHLIINQTTAAETGPVGRVWFTEAFRGLAATVERLRVDRQLDEALTHGPDPLHLASVFGLGTTTAIRYAEAASRLMQGNIEQQDPKSSSEPKGRNGP